MYHNKVPNYNHNSRMHCTAVILSVIIRIILSGEVVKNQSQVTICSALYTQQSVILLIFLKLINNKQIKMKISVWMTYEQCRTHFGSSVRQKKVTPTPKKKPQNCKPAESPKQPLDIEGVVCLKYPVQDTPATGWFSYQNSSGFI